MEIARKKYKVEFEVTVSMSEVEKVELFPDSPPNFLDKQKRFQKALLQDDEAENLVFISYLFSTLSDYVSSINEPEISEVFTKKLIAALDAQVREFFLAEHREGYLFNAIEPVAHDSISASVDKCEVIEVITDEHGQSIFRPAWEETEHYETIEKSNKKRDEALREFREQRNNPSPP